MSLCVTFLLINLMLPKSSEHCLFGRFDVLTVYLALDCRSLVDAVDE